MRSRFVKFSSAMTVAVVLAACGDNPTQETGPVTLRFKTPTFQNSVSSLDTVRGIVLIDGVTTVAVPEDTIANFPRGVHTFEARLDIDYLVAKFSQRINPRGKVAIVSVQPAGTCRIYDFDVPVLRWSQRDRAEGIPCVLPRRRLRRILHVLPG